MKFIHCADIHLGSKMEAKLPKDKADERKLEVRAAFDRMIDHAVKNGISVILLSGDVFDGDRPLKRDKDYFTARCAVIPTSTLCICAAITTCWNRTPRTGLKI